MQHSAFMPKIKPWKWCLIHWSYIFLHYLTVIIWLDKTKIQHWCQSREDDHSNRQRSIQNVPYRNMIPRQHSPATPNLICNRTHKNETQMCHRENLWQWVLSFLKNTFSVPQKITVNEDETIKVMRKQLHCGFILFIGLSGCKGGKYDFVIHVQYIQRIGTWCMLFWVLI